MKELFAPYNLTDEYPIEDILVTIPNYNILELLDLQREAMYLSALELLRLLLTANNMQQKRGSSIQLLPLLSPLILLQQSLTLSSVPQSIREENKKLTFELMLKKTGLDLFVRITSGFRQGSRTKSGHLSNHGLKDEIGDSLAYDIVPKKGISFLEMLEKLRNTPEMHQYLLDKGYRMLDETTKEVLRRTGGTGPHFHFSHNPKSKEGVQYAKEGALLDPIIEEGPTVTLSPMSILTKLDRLKYYQILKDKVLNLYNSSWFGNTFGSVQQTPSVLPLPPQQNLNTVVQPKLSEEMFEHVLKREGTLNFVAHSHKKDFGESFVTGPYGLVYKHIDANGNLLPKAVRFKEGEKVDPNWARANAKAFWDKRAKEWYELLKGLPGLNLDRLDALVLSSGGTHVTTPAGEWGKFIKENWGNWDVIDKKWRTFAIKASNGKVMPGLVRSRNFLADRFKGIHKDFSEYKAH